MKRKMIWVLAMVAAIGLLCSPAMAVDVYGPFNNTQTAVAYHYSPPTSYLWALNAADQPHRTTAGVDKKIGSLTPWPPVGDPARWETIQLINAGNPDWTRFPSMINEDNADNNQFWLDAAAHTDYHLNPFLAIGGRNVNWHQMLANPFLDPMSISRLAAQRANRQIQWAGCDWSGSAGTFPFVTSQTGFMQPTYIATHGLPVNCMDYSMAMDDGHGNRGIAVLAEAHANGIVNFNQFTDPHTDILATPWIFFTMDGGNTWQPVNGPNFPQQPIQAFYNAQVAMIPVSELNPGGDQFVFIIGMNGFGVAPTNFFYYTIWHDNGVFDPWFVQHDPFPNPSNALPSYPFDMIAERTPDHHGIQLLVATANELWYTDLNTIFPHWIPRMGVDPDRIMTFNFHDIAVNTSHREVCWAVAGESCSYMTMNAGETWIPITGYDHAVRYPQSAAEQNSHSLMAVAYSRTPLSSFPGTIQHYAPVCIQVSAHQDHQQVLPFGRTTHIGWAYAGLAKVVPFDMFRTDPATYLTGYADPFIVISPMLGQSVGVVYFSHDEGMNWSPATFTHRMFPVGEQHVPQPSHILTDVQDGHVAMMTFSNPTGQGGHLEEIPPFCMSHDGGETWTTPANNGLGVWATNAGERRLTSGYNDDHHRWIYMTVGGHLFYTWDEGDNWTEPALPPQMAGHDIVSLSCSNIQGKKVELATSDYFAYSPDYGTTWTTVAPHLPGSVFERVYWDPFDQSELNFYAIVRATNMHNPIQTLLYSPDGGHTWQTVGTWGEDQYGYYPYSTDLYVERMDDMNRRLIWTALGGAAHDYIAELHPWLTSVKYFEFTLQHPAPRVLDADNSAPVLPTAYALMPNYPNPFNPTTTIAFDLKASCDVSLKVYDINGREVAALVNGHMEAGHYTRTFDANGLPSGVYMVRMTTPEFTSTNKMVLLK